MAHGWTHRTTNNGNESPRQGLSFPLRFDGRFDLSRKCEQTGLLRRAGFLRRSYLYRSQLRFSNCFAFPTLARRRAVRHGWCRGGRQPSQVMPANRPRAWQFDRRTCTSMAASYRCAVAAKEAEESLAAAVSCTSELGAALLLAAGTAHAWAVLIQRQEHQPRPLVHGILPLPVCNGVQYTVACCCCGTT